MPKIIIDFHHRICCCNNDCPLLILSVCALLEDVLFVWVWWWLSCGQVSICCPLYAQFTLINGMRTIWSDRIAESGKEFGDCNDDDDSKNFAGNLTFFFIGSLSLWLFSDGCTCFMISCTSYRYIIHSLSSHTDTATMEQKTSILFCHRFGCSSVILFMNRFAFGLCLHIFQIHGIWMPIPNYCPFCELSTWIHVWN